MSSKQSTLGYIGTETPEEPRWSIRASIGPVPNFDREAGEEQTELGADLSHLCERLRAVRE